MTKLKENSPIKKQIRNFHTNDIYTLESLDESHQISHQDITDIIKICNEELIYDFLFREKLKGIAYSYEKAFGFVNHAWDGWFNDTNYIFIIRNFSGNIVGSIDIKSHNLDEGEIGYWLSKDASGVMTNAVIEISNIAKSTGYKKLFALTLLDNHKSQATVKRAGFIEIGKIDRNAVEYIKFEKEL